MSSNNSFSSAFSWERRDLRVEDWPMMSSAWPSLALCAAYVVAVKVRAFNLPQNNS